MAIVVQTNYELGEEGGTRAYAGMILDGCQVSCRSATVAPDGGIMNFGAAAFAHQYRPDACTRVPAAGKFLGIATTDAGIVEGLPIGFNTADSYEPLSNATLLARGRIMVIAGANVTAGQPAFVTVSGPGGYGSITNVASGNVAIPARFDATRLAGSLVPLKVFA